MDSDLGEMGDLFVCLIFLILIQKTHRYIQTHYDKVPRHPPPRDTEIAFQGWIQRAHPQACIDRYRMPIETFMSLYEWLHINAGLKDSRWLSGHQKLSMFLRICGSGPQA
jgi:hypothetical protein